VVWTGLVWLRIGTSVELKNGVFWVVTMWLVRTNVLEELSASIIRVTRIGELGIT
jgi:hypothetical protein